jgi:hypothetical protein
LLENNNQILKYVNLVTLFAAILYLIWLFSLAVRYTPSQIGFVLLIALIAYKNFKKPDLIWTVISALSMVGMWVSVL